MNFPAILVTGTTGFIACNFEKYSTFRKIRKVSLRTKLTSEIDFKGIDVVLHLAAIVHCNKQTSPDAYFKINRDLSVSLAEHAKAAGVRQFIFMSTIKVYGEFQEGMEPWNELSECHPTDYYGRSKREAELGLQKLNDENFRVSIIRTPLVYGPGMKANMLKLKKLVQCFPVLPLGGINNERNYTYIENLVDYVDKIISSRSQGIFIAMDEEPVSTTRLIKFYAEAMNKKILLVRLPGFLLKIVKNLFPENFKRLYGSFRLDNNHTRKLLGFNPAISTRDGIFRTIK